MGESENPSFPWFRDFPTCPWAPKPTWFISGDPNIPQIIQGTSQVIFDEYEFEKYEHFGNHFFWKFRKRRAPKSHGDPSQIFVTSWLRINIYQKAWTCFWKSQIRDQYLSKNIELQFGNMGSISIIKTLNLFRNFNHLKLWNQETNKSRNQETKRVRNQETKKPRN